MRKIIAKCGYLVFTELIAVYLIAVPVQAFLISSSSTGYVRVATQASQLAYVAAQRASMIASLAPVVAAPTAASIAIRLATGPVGWALLGVGAAVTLAQMYYSASEIAALKTAASPVPSGPATTYTYNGQNYAMPTNQFAGSPQNYANCTNSGGKLYGWPGGKGPYPGWTATPVTDWYCGPSVPFTPAQPPTQQQVVNYLTALSPADAKSPESHTTPVGQGVQPTPADNVSTNPVSPTEIAPTVKPAAQVLPTDAVIDPNAPPPTGPQPVTTPTSTTTTTTTTTTNPDGSTTAEAVEEPGVMSCSIGNHDQRTFGSVLQTHMSLWQASGLVSALNLIKNLTWPETIPTYALSSTIFGAFTLDFSGWSGILLALRGLVIAIASFVAYRIIFVGSK